MANITTNFQLCEFTATATGLPNVPNERCKNNIYFVAGKLQLLRDHLLQPIFIESGYRSKAVNSAVGGSPTSLHLSGLAADIHIPASIPFSKYPSMLGYIINNLDPYELKFNAPRILHISWLPPHIKNMNYDSFTNF